MNTTPDRPIDDEELHAFVDGQLDADRTRTIENYLRENVEAAAQVSAYRAQNQALHDSFDEILDDPVPPTLLIAARTRVWWRGWATAAAAAAIVIGVFAGGAGGWYARGLQISDVNNETRLTRHAASAHRIYTAERRFAVEVVAKEEKRMVRWLSKRLGHQLRVPSLSKLGFELIGGRQLATAENLPAAQFMYQDKNLRRLTLYVRKAISAEPTSFRFARTDDILLFYWIDTPFSYALAGKLQKDELFRVSRMVSEQISP